MKKMFSSVIPENITRKTWLPSLSLIFVCVYVCHTMRFVILLQNVKSHLCGTLLIMAVFRASAVYFAACPHSYHTGHSHGHSLYTNKISMNNEYYAGLVKLARLNSSYLPCSPQLPNFGRPRILGIHFDRSCLIR